MNVAYYALHYALKQLNLKILTTTDFFKAWSYDNGFAFRRKAVILLKYE